VLYDLRARLSLRLDGKPEQGLVLVAGHCLCVEAVELRGEECLDSATHSAFLGSMNNSQRTLDSLPFS
jgi:hypothetical protein